MRDNPAGSFLQLSNDMSEVHRPGDHSVPRYTLRAIGLVLCISLAATALRLWRVDRRNNSRAAAASHLSQLSGARSDDPQLLAQALARVDLEMQADPSAPEPQLNRAFILARLGLYHAAAQQLDSWRQVEPDSQRVAEVTTEYSSLRRQPIAELWEASVASLRAKVLRNDIAAIDRIVAAYPQQARVWAEGPFLTEWANAFQQANSAAAASELELVRQLGSALKRRHGDAFVSEVVALIESTEPAARVEVAEAQRLYDVGRRTYARREVEEAIPLLATSGEIFRRHRNPMALAADQFHASAVHDANEVTRAEQLLARVTRLVPERYVTRRGEIAWLRGTISGTLGRTYAAMLSYREAEQLFATAGETLFAARMSDFAAQMLTRLGRDGEAARMRRDAFRHASEAGDLEAVESMLTQAASDAAHLQRWDVAQSFYTLALDASAPRPNRRRRVHNLLGRAMAFEYSSRHAEAVTDLDRAALTAASLTDVQLHAAASHDVSAVRALLEGTRSPSTAYAELSRSIDFARKSKRAWLPRLLVQRARIARHLKRLDDARVDLREAIREIEQRRAQISSNEIRDTFLGITLDAYDEQFDLAEATGDFETAFATAERQRGRSVSEKFASIDTSPGLDLRTLPSLLGPGKALIHYTSLEDRVVIFAVDRHGVQHARVSIPRARLRREIESFRKVFGGTAADVLAASTMLRKALLEPISPILLRADELVIVTDETTNQVPFGAIGVGEKTFALERWTITRAPSATAHVQMQEAFAVKRVRPQRALVIGDPAFDVARYDRLPRLPGAADEAADVALLYGSKPWTGKEATRMKLTNDGGNSDVVHVAAHAVLDFHEPDRSALLLADGELTIRDLSSITWTSTPVVVLAGCRTGIAARRNDLSSFANAFLAVGARAVLATLWDVPDGEAGELAYRFHRELLAGEKPARALAEAQRELIHSGESPRLWAAFQFYGNGD
jgi:CHAT domain-containing protein